VATTRYYGVGVLLGNPHLAGRREYAMVAVSSDIVTAQAAAVRTRG